MQYTEITGQTMKIYLDIPQAFPGSAFPLPAHRFNEERKSMNKLL